MVSFLGHLLVVLLTMGTARAEDGDSKEDGIKQMLDNIPTIVIPKEKVEERPQAAKPLDYNSYNRQCGGHVMPHFRPPGGVVKKNPDIELELLVAVDLDGRVSGVSAGSRSGSTAFDKAAIKALDKAGDLPVPPKGWNVDKDRVILTFRGR